MIWSEKIFEVALSFKAREKAKSPQVYNLFLRNREVCLSHKIRTMAKFLCRYIFFQKP